MTAQVRRSNRRSIAIVKSCANWLPGDGPRLAAREEPEDPVQSALASFCRGVQEQRFRVDHSGALWRLLETITRHKMLSHIAREDADGRNPDREAGPAGE